MGGEELHVVALSAAPLRTDRDLGRNQSPNKVADLSAICELCNFIARPENIPNQIVFCLAIIHIFTPQRAKYYTGSERSLLCREFLWHVTRSRRLASCACLSRWGRAVVGIGGEAECGLRGRTEQRALRMQIASIKDMSPVQQICNTRTSTHVWDATIHNSWSSATVATTALLIDKSCPALLRPKIRESDLQFMP